ncbi:MAG TPA: DUF4442 domain-containing protein [Flavitalea sp.]|nr:DUF4442 domain-containing protein [Flavitalea sp.]
MSAGTESFLQLVNHPFKSRMFLLSRLPSAFFAGVRIRDANANSCRVTVPYTWYSANPFRSTYFACLAMAAELSTGVLAMAHLSNYGNISMLVVKLEAEYHKKATARTTFICSDGDLFKAALDHTIRSGQSETVTATSVGKDIMGESIATFRITWSFKSRKKVKNENAENQSSHL